MSITEQIRRAAMGGGKSPLAVAREVNKRRGKGGECRAARALLDGSSGNPTLRTVVDVLATAGRRIRIEEKP